QEQTVYRASGGPSNEDAIGARAAVAALLQVADRAIAKASVAHHQLARAVIAVAGTDTEDLTRPLRAARRHGWIGVHDVVAAMAYTKPLTKAQIASFASRTAALADGGDAVARELFLRAGRDLGTQIAVVIGQTGLAAAGDAFPVGLIGSVFRAGPLIVDPLA